jgi:hypothetical protein
MMSCCALNGNLGIFSSHSFSESLSSQEPIVN